MKVPLIEGRKIWKRFGGVIALKDVSFTLEEETITGLIGPNGSGKTTLFNVISGFYRPDSGKVLFEGKEIKGKPHVIRLKGIARTFQVPRPLSNLTVYENLIAGLLFGGKNFPKNEVNKLVEETACLLGLEGKMHILVKDLNVYNKKLVEFGRAIIGKPKVVLVDELLAGLTPKEVDDMLAVIKKVQRESGITVFIIEHIMRAIMKICTKIIVLHHGEKIAEGAPSEVRKNELVIEAYLGRGIA